MFDAPNAALLAMKERQLFPMICLVGQQTDCGTLDTQREKYWYQ